MSRFESIDEYDSVPPGLWEGAFARALNSPRGQRALREIEAALLALPTPELLDGLLVTDTGEEGPVACAVGAYAIHCRVMREGESFEVARAHVFEEWGSDDAIDWNDTVNLGVNLGLARTIAYELAWLNDETLGRSSPSQRYTRVLDWVRKRLHPPVEVAP